MYASPARNLCTLGSALGALLLIAGPGTGEEPGKLVEETCDEIAIVYTKADCGPDVVFLRNSRIMYRRSHTESMLLVVEGDTFTLMWTDWGCDRAVSTKKLGVYEIEPLEVTNSGPWWVAPVRQLKQP